MSNQCMALPLSTASTEASGSGIASALPDRARTAGSERRSSVSIGDQHDAGGVANGVYLVLTAGGEISAHA